MKTNFFEIKPFKAIIKSRKELIKLGCIDSDDKNEFINKFSSRLVTINIEREDGKTFVCVEEPEYEIYDIFIEKVIPVYLDCTSDFDVTLSALKEVFNFNSEQAVSVLIKRTLKKIAKINKSKELFELYC
ncbi:hypothetical protein CP985_03220 [Malaciobacter mytili LMG 24559]|uniref:Uncharacterized protein n=1 Tax=Malaciobacter mytili LMG 24559 TaxID=1032238 RepID=A0AAX2AHF2_9BACT|nr:hypothetical protein [Malaciobacter mytili]AXH16370.1 hypothetical protein AMYT_a0070 [Malaciobacter mytili LMG 24559]RXK16434.1 hypothetical protein CP985_03220 [Malaciobacter mytili LMG 24559]